MSPFIAETPQIKRAVEIINQINDQKFDLLLQRISQRIHLRVESSFKGDEIEKLEKSLNLTNDHIRLVIDILEFIYLQAAYELIKQPNLLQDHLLNLNLNENKSKAIAESWKENGRTIIDNIKQTRTQLGPNRLQIIKWRLNLQLATNTKTKQKIPTSLFEFTINKDSHDNNINVDKVKVEFDRESLFKFYENLELIQRQLDHLSA
jgi:COMM domain containing 10